jgi:2-amino-4-hydroxy-6-hydroxymethyldihydropteridine diphosphokinase
MHQASYAIAIGSNRRHGRHGSPERVIAAAADALAEAGLTVEARSPVHRSAALGPAGRGFANAAVLVSTPLSPPALLDLLKRIERDFGRRGGRRWGQRVLDLDILLWSGGHWPPAPRARAPGRLAVPHRALPERHFALVPLAAIAPGWRLPDGATVRRLLSRLKAGKVDRSGRPQ